MTENRPETYEEVADAMLEVLSTCVRENVEKGHPVTAEEFGLLLRHLLIETLKLTHEEGLRAGVNAGMLMAPLVERQMAMDGRKS